ncbi:MAG: DUF1244 domain-containing protein [Alphaproteobacteria bacterium]
MAQLSEEQTLAVEAAAFRRLVEHLRANPQVQNIALMNLAGFCRNCLANWYQEAAAGEGVALDKSEAREIIYGMPYEAWREQYQSVAPAEARADFAKRS